MSGSVEEFVVWLAGRHAELKDLETRAKTALYQEKDDSAYRELMQKRAEKLAGLDAEAESLLETLPDPLRETAGAALRRFAKGARNSLRIGSVFYMSALLYPDEHKEGEPDNMERLIGELRSSGR